VGLTQAASVSSPSLTRVSSTLPVLMLEGSPSHGAPPGWTTGARPGRDTGGTVILTSVLLSHTGDEMGGGLVVLANHLFFKLIILV